MIMETVSPIAFMTTYLFAPFSPTFSPPPLHHPSTLLAGLFILHYLNRAIVSPLRSPGRSRTHMVVPICGVIFNLINPPLMAAYLSAPPAPTAIEAKFFNKISNGFSVPPSQFPFSTSVQGPPSDAWSHASYSIGILIYFLGLISNIIHDEILYDLRRNHPPSADGKPRYAIPKGGLYKWISYPNYLSEWIEWTGFAIAATAGQANRWEYTAPWVFVVSEVALMLPRAWKGHLWYHQKFRGEYPKERKVIIPFLF